MESDEHARLQQILAGDRRFPIEAYLFIEVVARATGAAQQRRDRHATYQRPRAAHDCPETALAAIRILAIDVRSRGISRAATILATSFNLVEVGLLGTSPNDSKSDFADVFDFTAAFVEPFVARGPKPQLPLLDVNE